jgi:hypothetical protein
MGGASDSRLRWRRSRQAENACRDRLTHKVGGTTQRPATCVAGRDGGDRGSRRAFLRERRGQPAPRTTEGAGQTLEHYPGSDFTDWFTRRSVLLALFGLWGSGHGALGVGSSSVCEGELEQDIDSFGLCHVCLPALLVPRRTYQLLRYFNSAPAP